MSAVACGASPCRCSPCWRLAYLVAMVVTGAQPVQRQLVKFEAKGVLQIEPEAVQEDHARRRRTAGRCCVRSGDGGWALEAGGAVEAAAATHLDTAVKMLHRSAPVREIAPEELSGVDTASVRPRRAGGRGDARGPGGQGADGALSAPSIRRASCKYMRIDGDPKVYLMSRFIGAEWTAALEGVKAR